MGSKVRNVRSWWLVLGAVCLLAASVPAQQQTGAPPASDELMSPEQFTETLKQVWSFLKVEMEKYLEAIKSKGEFETSSEYDRRATDSRRLYVAAVMKYSTDQKLNERDYNVLFKAVLGAYDADKQMFPLNSSTIVDAPYNIPIVQCVIRKNSYIAMADSIRRGYRTSSVYINLPKSNKWQVSRDLARSAKADEDQIYFRVKMRINIEKTDLKDQAVLELVPRQLALINNKTGKVYWTAPIQ